MVRGRVIVEFGAGAPLAVSSTCNDPKPQEDQADMTQPACAESLTDIPPATTAVPESTTTDALTSTSTPAMIWPDNPSADWKQSRTFTNISQVIHEYCAGCGSMPPVREIEQQYNSKWRKSASNRKFFSQRNSLYKAVIHTSLKLGISLSEAATLWDAKRKDLGFSLAVMQPWMWENKDVL